MMKKYLGGLLVALCVGFLAVPETRAADKTYVCDALKEKAAYKGKASYRYMVEGENGFVFRSRKDFKTDFSLTPATLAKFKFLSEAFAHRGADLVLLMPPMRTMTDHDILPAESPFLKKPFDFKAAHESYEGFLKSLKDEGLHAVDFTGMKYPNSDFYFLRDHHWRPEGAKLSAQYTAKLIRDLPAYKDAKEIKFETRQNGTKGMQGSFEKFIEKACNGPIENEKFPLYETTRKAGKKQADDLFGDEEISPIVLIGTSNTTEPNPSYANFAGFLREELSRDVHNASMAGAGIDAPLLDYLGSANYIDHPPRIAVWEVAPHYDFNGGEFKAIFNEGPALAFGPCTDKAVLAADLTPQKALDVTKQKIEGGKNYVRLTLSKPVEKSFKVQFIYGDKEQEVYEFERTKRAPAEDVFAVMVPAKDGQGQVVSSIMIGAMPEGITGAALQVCAVPKR